MKLEFIEETHEYYIIDGDNRERIPSNNQILEYSGIKPKLTFENEAIRKGRDRGKRTHKLSAIFAEHSQNRIQWTADFISNLEDDVSKYVEAFIDFWTFKNPTFLISEKQIYIYEDNIKYAGTLDLLVVMDGQYWIIEIKTGQKAKWHKVQLAGYGYPSFGYRLGLLYLNDKYEFVPIELDEQRELYQKWEGAVRGYWKENIWCL